MEDFLKLILKNLETNGFPAKSITFNLEKMYEMADNRGLNFNDVRERLKERGVETESQGERLLFRKLSSDQLRKQAEEMMGKMSPEELARVQRMFEEMSPEKKQEMMEQAKKMGLI